ncbi:MAG: phosphatase PAP2 family protein [Candidatus Rokubacteria bacterium]|nr:phosphatase PAP2 family protein [Candidatus Rokubacteria bacterium]
MSTARVLGLVDDTAKVCLALLLAALAVLGAWAAVDRRTRGAGLARQAFRLSGWPGRTLVVLLAAAVLVAVAEDVLNREREELVLRLDAFGRNSGRAAATRPGVRAAASLVSHATGEGLLVLVGVTAVLLTAARRRREAVVLLTGTLGAWLLANALKLTFAVRRPGSHVTLHEISGYGFPSAHALVTLVACGLVAWVAGRRAAHRTRVALYGVVLAIAGLSSAARVVLSAHWVSDVVAGLAIGMLWLVVVVLAASWWEARDLVPLREPPTARE